MTRESIRGAIPGMGLGGGLAALGLLSARVFFPDKSLGLALLVGGACLLVLASALASAAATEARARVKLEELRKRVEGLEAILGEVKALADGSIELGEDVEAATRRAASLSGEVGRGIDRDKELVAALDAQISLCREGVAMVKAGLDELAGEVMEDQSSSLTQSTAAIEEIVASVRAITGIVETRSKGTAELLALVEEGKVHMGASLSEIRALVQSAQGLIDIVGVIEDVAQRVDLLAMNAAIEAAHAREAGKGFAVVADEVRKLAVATDSQAKDISARLKAMIALMRRAERSTEETDLSFRRVIESARDVASGMAEISGGMREMSQGGSEILGAVQDLTEVTRRVRTLSAGTREGAAGADGAIAAIAGLSRDSLASAEATGGLVGEMDRTFALLLDQGRANAAKIGEMDAALARSGARRSASTIIVGYNEVPPFSLDAAPGQPPGAANAFLATVLGELGHRVGFKRVQSLERIYELLDRGDIDAYALATRAYEPRPELAYIVPTTPFLTPRPGLLVRTDSPVARGGKDLGGLRILTKTGMPLTKSLSASGAAIEYLGGPSPLLEGLRLVAQGRADGVYSVIAAELSYMAKEDGLAGALAALYLPDPPIELYIALSAATAIDVREVESGQRSLLARKPMASFLEPYLGAGTSL